MDRHDTDVDEPEVNGTKGSNDTKRVIKDPVHDMIPISSRLSTFIDTKQFQRLRNIKQLGTSYYVWPGASHNRFEHCIGVAHLARWMATHLSNAQPELGITERDIECVQIAGLCHDLGHGPWSHVWDGLFIPRALPGRRWKHEHASVMMFDALVRENDIDMSPKDERFIKALISGEPGECDPDEKPFLFDIVANKRNGLDVDKFDYIPRDSHMIGDKMNISYLRIIKSARVLDNQICYDIKDANLLYSICSARFTLHKMVYNHKAAKAIEYMVVDALLAAEPYLHIAEQVFDPDRFLYLTDNILLTIEASTDPNLAPARAIVDRIRTRDNYKLVDYKAVDSVLADEFKKHITPEAIVAEAKALRGIEDRARGLQPNDVICDFSMIHYGMKEENPIDFVRFYSKRHPDRATKAVRGDISTIMPPCHMEFQVKIFTKNTKYFGVVQAGYRACLANLEKHLMEQESSFEPTPLFPDTAPAGAAAEPTAPTPTPPAPDAPSTPKQRTKSFSRVSSFGFASADATPFANNEFTTVSTGFVPLSPSRGSRRAKRRWDAGPGDGSGSRTVSESSAASEPAKKVKTA
ncbi:putative metal dependent phosphohydrolases with conserved 'HD' motif [Lyophyllum shimeji]|uniref:Metal dependent phosphohydrolases with conserved 'HD' motif n=1 Tax=Lyophyllum shimeji TaxID=47721 RepID=A0A9P3PCE7_LYOSH|nr:putative metal dependent phosphohydrolases with conserved 'HD' motif [Lyophyllum shimeji]